MESAAELAGDGATIRFLFLVEDGESSVGRCAGDLRQRGVLEVHLPVVDLGGRHCRLTNKQFCYYDESEVNKVNC